VDFDYSEEQHLLADSVARFVREEYSFEARRAIVKSPRGYAEPNWQLFAELGWLALPVAEEDGGLGGSLTDLAILFEHFGKGLVLEPYLATVVLGAGLVSELGSPSQREAMLPALVAGELQLAVAFAEPQSRYSLSHIHSTAERSAEDWTLTGRKCVVLNATAADVLLVSARDAAGDIGVFRVPRDSEGLTLHGYATIDGGRAADLELAGVRLPADALLGTPAAGLGALGRVIDRATLCVCAEALGAMDALLWKTVEYTKTRRQFGVAIASFQALQHRMAGMFIELEQSRSILMMALMAAEAGEELARAVSAAKSRIGRAARRIGQEAIQLHGGIGVTDELDVGHYFKRLTAIETLFGNTDFHLRRFGEAHDR
jgi:alkylation response protein AidB-like acyl-CoA dehydrogenase